MSHLTVTKQRCGQMEAEMEEEIAGLDDEIMDDEKGAITETMASELAAIDKKTSADRPPGEDLR